MAGHDARLDFTPTLREVTASFASLPRTTWHDDNEDDSDSDNNDDNDNDNDDDATTMATSRDMK